MGKTSWVNTEIEECDFDKVVSHFRTTGWSHDEAERKVREAFSAQPRLDTASNMHEAWRRTKVLEALKNCAGDVRVPIRCLRDYYDILRDPKIADPEIENMVIRSIASCCPKQ